MPCTDVDDELNDFIPKYALGLSQAAQLIRGHRSNGKPPAVSTLRRWITIGCRPAGPDGPVVRLRAVYLTQEWLVMRSWVEAFDRERARLARRPAPLTGERAPRSRAADRRRAARVLDEAGVGSRARKPSDS